jgi:hypothetical protein
MLVSSVRYRAVREKTQSRASWKEISLPPIAGPWQGLSSGGARERTGLPIRSAERRILTIRRVDFAEMR